MPSETTREEKIEMRWLSWKRANLFSSLFWERVSRASACELVVKPTRVIWNGRYDVYVAVVRNGEAGTEYAVLITPNKRRAACTCPDWRYNCKMTKQKALFPCKHIIRVAMELQKGESDASA